MIENYFSLPLFMEVNEKYDLFYEETEKAISSARKDNSRFISRLLGGMERETQPQPTGLLDGGFMSPYEKPNFLEFYDLFLKKYIYFFFSILFLIVIFNKLVIFNLS